MGGPWHNSCVPPDSKSTGLGADLAELAAAMESLPVPPASELAAEYDRLIRAIRHNIRLVAWPDAPLRVVFAGPTGSGKSTLLNGVVGRQVTPSGSMRPTTRLPLVFTKPDFAPAFFDADIEYQVVTGEASILDHMCLIDTPDIDSTNRANHQLARFVLQSADVVVFVASALRYADLVPWHLLRELEEREVPVIHALNRISTSSAGVVTDFRRLLRREGMSEVVVRVEEHRIRPGGLVPSASIRSLRRRLLEIVRERKLNSEVLIEAGIADVSARSNAIADEVDLGAIRVRALAKKTAEQLADLRSLDLSEQVGTWSMRLHSEKDGRNVRRSWLRRHGLSPDAVELVCTQLRTELIRALEGRVRPLNLERGRVVIDLRSHNPGQSQLLGTLIESGVNGWYDDIAPPLVLSPEVYGYRRAREALAAVEYVFGARDSEPTPAGLRLEQAIAEIARRVESTILRSADPVTSGIDTAPVRVALQRLIRAPILADA